MEQSDSELIEAIGINVASLTARGTVTTGVS